MDMKLFKRGKVYYIRLNENRKKSLKTTDKKTAEKLFRRIKKRELDKKLLLLDGKKRISISEFIPLYINDPDRKTLAWKTLEADELAFNLLKDAVGDIPLKLLDKETIKEFKTISLGRVKPVSVNTYMRHIKAGLSWAMEEGFIDKMPQIKMLKLGQKLPRHLSLADIKKILKLAKKEKPAMHLIINFALFTGCRREEIIKARYEHINNGIMKIYGKGNKERLIPLLPQALDVQQNIGKIFPYKHVSTVSNYFREIAKKSGVKARFHDLRHTAATQMLSSGIQLGTVQEILGHTDIRTTKIYATVLAQTMQNEMQKMSGLTYE